MEDMREFPYQVLREKLEYTLIQGPFIHHCAMAYGHFADALVEACRFIPGLQAVRLGHEATSQ